MAELDEREIAELRIAVSAFAEVFDRVEHLLPVALDQDKLNDLHLMFARLRAEADKLALQDSKAALPLQN